MKYPPIPSTRSMPISCQDGDRVTRLPDSSTSDRCIGLLMVIVFSPKHHLTGLMRSGGDKAGLVSKDDRLHAVAQVELGEDPRHMRFHRRLAERQRRCEFRVGHAPGDKAEDLEL